jgi:hypothetical protein
MIGLIDDLGMEHHGHGSDGPLSGIGLGPWARMRLVKDLPTRVTLSFHDIPATTARLIKVVYGSPHDDRPDCAEAQGFTVEFREVPIRSEGSDQR